MNKRLFTAGMWFLAAAYAGAMLHTITGIHELLGPVIGLATGVLIVMAPGRAPMMSSGQLKQSNAEAASKA
jgi:hypothetical protein